MQTRGYADVHIPSSFEMQARFITLVARAKREKEGRKEGRKKTHRVAQMTEFDTPGLVSERASGQIRRTVIGALTIARATPGEITLRAKRQELTGDD